MLRTRKLTEWTQSRPSSGESPHASPNSEHTFSKQVFITLREKLRFGEIRLSSARMSACCVTRLASSLLLATFGDSSYRTKLLPRDMAARRRMSSTGAGSPV